MINMIVKIKCNNITNMTKQPLQNNHYMPNRAHTYYPIQTKRSAHQTNPLPLLPRPDKHKEREVDVLKRQNEELRERQEIYIDKLMKLEEGLENQHSQFIKLQELYTELFQSYKQKEAEINELQMKFRESDRYREQQKQIELGKPKEHYRHDSRAKEEYSFQEREWSSKQEEWQFKEQSWMKKEKEWLHKEKQLNQYIEALNKKTSAVSESYDRLFQELSSLKTKQRPNSIRAALSQKTLEEFQQWQKQIQSERENRLKFQYENEFLKSRNADLQTQREELQKLLTYKQKQISKLREQKIKIHRQSSQKFIQRSPAKVAVKSKASQMRNEKQIEKQNRQVFIQNRLNASVDSNHQYFSFSRQKHEYSIDSQLPNFPPQLEIDSLITEHKK